MNGAASSNPTRLHPPAFSALHAAMDPAREGATAYIDGITDAAQALGVAPNTLRAMLKRGELRGERVPRAQGHVWRVWLPSAGQTPSNTAPSNGASSTLHCTQQDADSSVQALQPGLPPAIMAAWIAQLREDAQAPLLAQLERASETITAKAEQVGRLTAENAQ